MPDLIRRVARGPLKGRLATVFLEDPRTGLLHARVAKDTSSPAPDQFDFKVQPTLFQPSYLKEV